MERKVTVIGAGNVGATCAQRIVECNLADVVLLDIVEGLPQGKALDMMESAPIEGFTKKIVGTNDYADTKDSDVVVITAGLARKPGMSRDELLVKNAAIVESSVAQIIKYSPQCIIIIVTNPLDVMSYLAWRKTGIQAERVIGMAGVLDSARFRYFVAEALGCVPSEVEAMVLGGHGDTMVPLSNTVKYKGALVSNELGEDRFGQLIERTRKGGAEIVSLLKTGSAYYAPSSSAVAMVKSILLNERTILPCCAYLDGHYGLSDLYFGVPVRLSEAGVEEIIELEVSPDEKEALLKSAESVRNNIKKLSL